jgi:hypothetical protein
MDKEWKYLPRWSTEVSRRSHSMSSGGRHYLKNYCGSTTAGMRVVWPGYRSQWHSDMSGKSHQICILLLGGLDSPRGIFSTTVFHVVEAMSQTRRVWKPTAINVPQSKKSVITFSRDGKVGLQEGTSRRSLKQQCCGCQRNWLFSGCAHTVTCRVRTNPRGRMAESEESQFVVGHEETSLLELLPSND